MEDKKISIRERKYLVRVGQELGTLDERDIAFIMDPANGEWAVDRRMFDARLRSCSDGACKQTNATVQ